MQNFFVRSVTSLMTGRWRAIAGSLAVVVLSACGDGGGSNRLPVSTTTLKGQFIDSLVSGLEYQTEHRSGVTDGSGTFEYDLNGEIITFSIGNTVLGVARANSLVHVFDVAGQNQFIESNRGSRVAQLLQTLDEDGNSNNGIQISAATKSALLAQPFIDFTVSEAGWGARLASVATSTSKTVVPMKQAISHAEASQKSSSNCIVPDAIYPLSDIENLGKFSTAGRTCEKKARAMAFYEDVNSVMLAAGSEYRNSRYIADGETIAQKDVETLAKNNLVNNTLNVALDHISFLDVKGKTSAETFAKIISNTSKLTKDIVTWSTSLTCNIQGSCANPQEFAVKMTGKVADIVSKTSACFTGKMDKCADAIKTSTDINELLDASYGGVSDEKISKLADFAAAWVGALADGWDALNDGNLSNWMVFTGSLADTWIKTKTNYYTRSDNETAHRTATVNAAEISGEGLKIFTACYLPKSAMPTDIVKHYSKCADEMFGYANQRSAEIGSYFFMILTVSDLLARADDIDVARAVLSEWHHYDGVTGMFAHYGIAKPTNEAEVIQGLRKLLPMVAAKIGLDEARHRYVVGGASETSRVIDTIFMYFRSVSAKSAAILAGKFTSCSSVEIGEIDSPQFIRDARYPYLIAVQTNSPIYFTASYTPAAAVVGYEFNFGDGTILKSDLPAASYTYTHTNGYSVSVAPIIKSVNGSIRSCMNKRRVVGFRAKDLTPKVLDVQPKAATIGVATTFTIKGANLPSKSVISVADGACNPPVFIATGFTAVCTPGGIPGDKVVTIKTDTLANGGTVIDASRVVTVSASPIACQPPQVLQNDVCVTPSSGTGKLPDTGITASQCYAAGSDALVSCTSAAAIALNSKQDGMVGRDVSNPGSSDGKLGFSYSAVGSYTKEECVKDNITGLTWEGKPTSGARAASAAYTNYGDNRAGDASAYVAAVNAAKLCGYTDWRLPAKDELQGIVDYSVASPGPTIDGTWFPNTQQYAYWTGTGYAGDSSYAWFVHFLNGYVDYGRTNYFHVRLVR